MQCLSGKGGKLCFFLRAVESRVRFCGKTEDVKDARWAGEDQIGTGGIQQKEGAEAGRMEAM
jgi:hypothetical protein